jgi:hypothetical protein
MKEIRTIKMIEQVEVKYFADDGKEFENERDCRVYEMQKDKDKLKMMYEALNPICVKSDVLDWFCCDSGLDIVTVKSQRDYNIVKAYFKHSSYVDFEVEEPKEYPSTLTIYWNEGYVGEPSFDKEFIRNEFLRLADMLK